MARRKDQDNWESWIDQQICEALERGEFDNLPGKRKPLDLTPNPYAGDQELAFKILKDAGYAPEWIELDKAIRARLEQARATLARRWHEVRAHLGELTDVPDQRAGTQWLVRNERKEERARAAWQAAIAAFEREIGAVNQEISELNLKVPSPRFQRSKVDATAEITRLATEGT